MPIEPNKAVHTLIDEQGTALYYPHFITPEVAALYQQELQNTLDWRQETVKLFGKTHLTPRLIAWHANRGLSYHYSGIEHSAVNWTPALLQLKQQVEQMVGKNFNAVLANLYRDGNDSIGWHSDNEKVLGDTPLIASISLGQSRRFLFKHRLTKKIVELILESGSLLIMRGELQSYWLHSIPKQKQLTQSRINLTFRQILSEYLA